MSDYVLQLSEPVPDGRYGGTWTLYEVTFKVSGVEHTGTCKSGVPAGETRWCAVIVKGGVATVEGAI